MISTNPIRIAIAEDHQVLIDGLTSLLEEIENFKVTLTANDGKSLLEQLENENVDVILMDINMPEVDGLEATKEIKANYTDVKVLILSMHDDLRLIKELLKAGADGYVLKNTGIDELTDAINKIATGENYFCKPIADKIMQVLLNKKEATGRQKGNAFLPVSITPREREILNLICMEYTSSEIAGELYISINTVETHRKNLLSKLNCKNSVGLVKYAITNNII